MAVLTTFCPRFSSAVSTQSDHRRLVAFLTAGLLAFVTCSGIGVAGARADDDPPSRVGRLAVMDGTVSFHTADQTTWGAATPNYPITSGNALWADNGAHAGIQLGANDINLGSQSELDIDRLDDQTFQASLPQGSVYLNLRGLNPGDQYQIATPRGTVSITQPGRYEISSGDQTHPGLVTVLEGAAQVNGDNINLPVAAGQSGVLSDNGQGGPVQATLAQAPGEDDLIAWARSREPQAAPPPAVAAMTGTQDLGNYGNWSSSPDYGSVWYPQVAAGWVPYRNGHWAWVAPWGWTWVDDAPWGFAPFHYGRWVQIGPRWAWAPRPIVVAGPYVPVYAPALVSFVGDIGGVGIGISIGGPSVGWVPLGPREVYYPPYRVSDRYRRNVNITYVKNVNIINVHNTTVINNVTVNHFANHGAVTVVSRDTLIQSRHVDGAVEHVNQADLAKMRGYNNTRPPFSPTAQTAGLTPRDAQHFGVSPQQIQYKKSSGPAIQQNTARNWDKFAPNNNNKATNLGSADHQNNGQQNPVTQNGNNRWGDQGSHKVGSAVQQKPQWMTNNGQQNKAQQSKALSNQTQSPSTLRQTELKGQGNQSDHQQQNLTNGNQQQHKSNWATNNQSHQPGATVTKQPTVWQQNQQAGKVSGSNGQQQFDTGKNQQPKTQTDLQNQQLRQQQKLEQEKARQQQQQQVKKQQDLQNAELRKQNTQRQEQQLQAQKLQWQQQQHETQQQHQNVQQGQNQGQSNQSDHKKPANQNGQVVPQ
jgi:hypothetical protein